MVSGVWKCLLCWTGIEKHIVANKLLPSQLKIINSVTGKRENVEISNSPQVEIEMGASRFNFQHSTKWDTEISLLCSASRSTCNPQPFK